MKRIYTYLIKAVGEFLRSLGRSMVTGNREPPKRMNSGKKVINEKLGKR
jgi:hypothetical protein